MNKINQSDYVTKKLDNVKEELHKQVKKIQPDSKLKDPEEIEDLNIMINQLKGKFNTSIKYSEKFSVLSVLPISWSIRKVEKLFGASQYMIREVKKKVDMEGILCTPAPRPGRGLKPEVLEAVRNFYESDEVSRQCAGAKEFKSVKEGNKRVHKQKRLLLANLSELKQYFKELHPDIKISFSKFAELRPPHCVLAGSSGTHNVCVCTFHQNVKLMISGANLEKIPSLGTYQACFNFILCEEKAPSCYLGNCESCPGVPKLAETLHHVLDARDVGSVVYKQWVKVDRCNLEVKEKLIDDFVSEFSIKVKQLAEHDFIAKKQAEFFKDLKATLKVGEVAVVADFAENYAFVCQDVAQGYHWNNDQATVHPFVCYYKESEAAEPENVSFVVISDHLEHNTVAVYAFQKVLISFLKEKLPFVISKIYYTSDGAASQYKNFKNVSNLCHHEEDFGIKAAWSYSATSHGKGPSDGIFGTIKRLARRASLQKVNSNHILNPISLYEWAKKSIKNINFVYVTSEEILQVEEELKPRFSTAMKVPGLMSLHSIIPLTKNSVWVKRYSSSAIGQRIQFQPEKPTSVEDIFQFCIIIDQNTWWLAEAKEKTKDSHNQITFEKLHPSGSRRVYYYPQEKDEVSITLDRVLLHVTPVRKVEKQFSLSLKAKQLAKQEIEKFIR